MKRFLLVIDSLGSGGAQRQLVNLAIGFKEKGHEVSFLVYHNQNFFQNILISSNIQVIFVIEPNYFKRFLKMRRIIRNGGYDAVLCFLEAPNFICEVSGLPWRKWKLVVGERSANPNILKSFKLRAFRWVHLLADHVVANSYENIKLVQKINPLLPSKKCRVIYNMVDNNRWKPSNKYIPRINDKFSLIVVSNHQKLKNSKGLVSAIKLLPDRYKSQLKVDWYGRKDSSEVIEAYEEVNKLVFKYKLENIISYFDHNQSIHEIVPEYDALGLFSFYEGLPNSICEAMTCGKPIISTNVSDIKLFIIDGVNGYISKSFEPESIKDSIIKLLDCSKKELISLGKNSEIKARELFDKDQIISEYLNLMLK